MKERPINAPLENRMAAYALGKTVAFCLYFVLGMVLLLPILLLSPVGRLPNWEQDTIFGFLIVGIAAGLLYLIIKGLLPGSVPTYRGAFSEKAIAGGVILISVLGSVLLRSSVEQDIFRNVLAGSLVFVGVVYFIVKSVISMKPRWGVLFAFLPSFLELISPLLSGWWEKA